MLHLRLSIISTYNHSLMANQVPDPRTLNSWEDAFQYPLPVVRKLEQQLRKNIDENRQKLRSLVGASYRDLLGTAERIIEMDDQMQTVEGHLGDIGRKCNARALERASESHARMMKTMDARETDKHGTMAQTKVLQHSLSVASRTIKAGGDALLVAKLLVLARLLHKSVAESTNPPAILDNLRRKLGILRKKLLLHVERALVKPNSERTLLANTLCAYSLVSSSTPKDVLRHFLQARLEQPDARSDTPSETTVLRMIDVYKHTLLDTRALFPRLFAEALSQLSNVPLLQDKQVSLLYELNLDIYSTWIADDIRSFTPWVRHEQLVASEVSEGLASWSKEAQASMLSAVRDCVRLESDASVLLDIRKKVLSQNMSLGITFRDGRQGEAIIDLRNAFIDRLKELANDCARSARSCLDVLDQPNQNATPHRASDLWSLALDDLELSGGAVQLRQTVLDRRNGQDATVRACVNKLDLWMSDLDSFWSLTQRMRTTRWDDELDIDFDDISNGVSAQDELSKGDSEQLQATFRGATSEALHQIYKRIKTNSVDNHQAVLFIRLSRAIEQRRLSIADRYGLPTDDLVNSEMMTTMHHGIAEAVSEAPLEQYATSVNGRFRAVVALWDDSPVLPIQPSPATFRFLTSLHKAMSEAGNDLWSPGAVEVLSTHLSERLAIVLSDSLSGTSGEEPALTNGHHAAEGHASNGVNEESGGEEPMHTDKRNKMLQKLFDALYLDRIASNPTLQAANRGLPRFVSTVKGNLELDDASNERLRKSANEYWKKTYSLFGLLAPGVA